MNRNSFYSYNLNEHQDFLRCYDRFIGPVLFFKTATIVEFKAQVQATDTFPV